MRSGVHDNCVFLGIQQSSMSSTENLYVFYKLLYLNVVNQNTSGDFFIFANCPKLSFHLHISVSICLTICFVLYISSVAWEERFNTFILKTCLLSTSSSLLLSWQSSHKCRPELHLWLLNKVCLVSLKFCYSLATTRVITKNNKAQVGHPVGTVAQST